MRVCLQLASSGLCFIPGFMGFRVYGLGFRGLGSIRV